MLVTGLTIDLHVEAVSNNISLVTVNEKQLRSHLINYYNILFIFALRRRTV